MVQPFAHSDAESCVRRMQRTLRPELYHTSKISPTINGTDFNHPAVFIGKMCETRPRCEAWDLPSVIHCPHDVGSSGPKRLSSARSTLTISACTAGSGSEAPPVN